MQSRVAFSVKKFQSGALLSYKKTFSTQICHEKDVIIENLQGQHEGITVLALNRPKVKNALSKSMVFGILEGLNNLKKDINSKVLILKSNVPGIFCAGADLKERVSMSEDEVKIFVKGLREMMKEFENLSLPVIAALDGSAMGGGLEMALACDLRVSSDTTKMGLVETRLAIIPGAGGTQRLPRLINPAVAKELIYTARLITGSEAKELGIVNHSIKQNDSGDAAFQKSLLIAQEMLPNGPIALKMAKKAISEGVQYSLARGYEIEQTCYEQVINTKDRLEGLKAFSEKRKPQYKGL